MPLVFRSENEAAIKYLNEKIRRIVVTISITQTTISFWMLLRLESLRRLI